MRTPPQPGKVDPRLDRHDHSRLQYHLAVGGQPRRLVDLQPQAVSQPMAEVPSEAGLVNDLAAPRRSSPWPPPGSNRGDGPQLGLQHNSIYPFEVWARFYRSPGPASSRSCRARRRPPNRSAQSRSNRSAGRLAGRAAAPPEAPPQRSRGNCIRWPPKSPHRGLQLGRPPASPSFPAAAPPRNDLQCLLGIPNRLADGDLLLAILDLPQLLDKSRGGNQSPAWALPRQSRPADRTVIESASTPRRPMRSRSSTLVRALSMLTPGRRMQQIEPGAFFLQLGGVTRVADEDLARPGGPAGSYRRR